MDVVDESDSERFVGGYEVASEHIFEGSAQAYEVGGVVGGGEFGGESDADESEGEAGALGGYADVAGECSGESLADGDAVDGGYDGFGVSDDFVPGVVHEWFGGVGVVAVASGFEAAYVGSGAESASGACPDDCADCVVGVPLFYLGDDFVVHAWVHGVEFVGSVHGDESDAAFGLGEDEFVGHGFAPVVLEVEGFAVAYISYTESVGVC